MMLKKSLSNVTMLPVKKDGNRTVQKLTKCCKSVNVNFSPKKDLITQ